MGAQRSLAVDVMTLGDVPIQLATVGGAIHDSISVYRQHRGRMPLVAIVQRSRTETNVQVSSVAPPKRKLLKRESTIIALSSMHLSKIPAHITKTEAFPFRNIDLPIFVLLTVFFMKGAWYSVASSLTKFGRDELQLSATTIGGIYSGIGLASALGAPMAGFLSRLCRKTTLMIVACVFLGVSFLIMSQFGPWAAQFTLDERKALFIIGIMFDRFASSSGIVPATTVMKQCVKDVDGVSGFISGINFACASLGQIAGGIGGSAAIEMKGFPAVIFGIGVFAFCFVVLQFYIVRRINIKSRNDQDDQMDLNDQTDKDSYITSITGHEDGEWTEEIDDSSSESGELEYDSDGNGPV